MSQGAAANTQSLGANSFTVGFLDGAFVSWASVGPTLFFSSATAANGIELSVEADLRTEERLRRLDASLHGADDALAAARDAVVDRGEGRAEECAPVTFVALNPDHPLRRCRPRPPLACRLDRRPRWRGAARHR